ncbi:MAG: DUF3999 family protein [Clostridia bacterium]|nr:DUF3999 family protein [Clostridia bacterium]
MKKYCLIFGIVFIWMSLAGTAFSIENISDWKYYKEIKIKNGNQYKALYLDDEVYRYSKSDLSDLRVIDSKGAAISYYIQKGWESSNPNTVFYEAERIHRFKENNHSFYNFKVIPVKSNTDIPVNKLFLSVEAGQYLKNIELYGSYDNVEWEYIMKDTIYKVENLTKNEIALNNTQKYKYYRIKVLNNIENINITKASVIYDSVNLVHNDYLKRSYLKYDMETKDRDTWITIQNGNKLKLKSFRIDAGGNFNRHYEIYEKNGNEYSYTGIKGEIYNLKFKDMDIANTVLDLSSQPLNSQLIRIKIFNQDDRPLDIKNIEVTSYVDKLVFESKGAKDNKLYFGSEKASKPQYEMETFKGHVEKESQDLCSLDKVMLNKAADKGKEQNKEDEKKINSKFIFNAVLILLSVCLIGLIAKKLRIRQS